MKILIGRTDFGLGDWIMFASLCKHVNQQYPHVQLDIDTTSLPLFFLQFLCYFDTRVTPVCCPNPSSYVVHIPHLVYPPPADFHEHLLQGMIFVFNRLTGLQVKLDQSRWPDQLAHYVSELTECRYTGRPVFIAPDNSWHKNKEWGWGNFQKLSTALLDIGVPVVQNRMPADAELLDSRVIVRDGSTLGALLSVMRCSRAVVTLENGISHFAGHHGIRCFTIYRPQAPAKPYHASYPEQIALTGDVDPVRLAGELADLSTGPELIESSMEDTL
jgi:ADP-heptose:LPS heptosyltransferase